MKVLHVLESLAAGGVETTFLSVMRHLPASIHSHVLAFAGGALEREFRTTASTVTISSSQAEIDRALVAGGYDAVYVLFERCARRILPTLVTRTGAVVVYGKNYDFSGQWRTTEGFRYRADDAMMAACDGVTFTTRLLAEGYDEPERERGTVLGKGAAVTPLLEIPPAGNDTPDRILVIANPNPRKRLGDLVAALPAVRQHAPRAEIRVIGAGDPQEEARLKRLAAERGVADAFSLAGTSRDVAQELAGARIVALSSGNEGVPTALLEGMAAARPIVTTDAGHVRSIVDDGVEGYVTAIGDVPMLSDRLTTLLLDRPLAAAMGQRGRERARQHAVERIAERLGALLEDRHARSW